VAQVRRPRAHTTRAEHARVNTSWLRQVNGWRGQWFALAIGMGGNCERRKQALCDKSSLRSLCLSLRLSLSPLSLSPAGSGLEGRAPRAPQVVVLSWSWSSPSTVVRSTAAPCAAYGQDVDSATPSVVTPCCWYSEVRPPNPLGTSPWLTQAQHWRLL